MIRPIDLAYTALHYGFIPIPLRGKVPIIPEWQRVTRETALLNFEKVGNRADSVGILTGAVSNITVLDLDTAAIPLWNQLISQYGEPYTFKVQTGGGGFHYYFAYDPSVPTTNKLKSLAIDIRSDGGQVVFPGSRHVRTGQLYLVAGGYEGYVPQIGAMPAWLKTFLSS